MSSNKNLCLWTCFGVLSCVRICLSTGWILPVYDVRSQERFAFAEDFLRLILLEQSEAAGGQFMEYALGPLDKEDTHTYRSKTFQNHLKNYRNRSRRSTFYSNRPFLRFLLAGVDFKMPCWSTQHKQRGYIINEEGQIVPFRIFKKGMCFLHPRNCRGGFHKRLTNEPSDQEADSIYNFRVSKRGSRLKPEPRKRQNNLQKYHIYDDEIFLPKSEMDEVHKAQKINFTPEELSLLKEYSLLKSNPESTQVESFGNLDRFIKQPIKQSSTANQYQKLVIPKYGISDLNSHASFDPYSRDSSLSIEVPVDTFFNKYLADDSIQDDPATKRRPLLSDYDIQAYPFVLERRR